MTETAKLAGVPKTARYYECIDLAAYAWKNDSRFKDSLEFNVDISQAIARKPWGISLPMAQRSLVYSFAVDRILDIEDYFVDEMELILQIALDFLQLIRMLTILIDF